MGLIRELVDVVKRRLEVFDGDIVSYGTIFNYVLIVVRKWLLLHKVDDGNVYPLRSVVEDVIAELEREGIIRKDVVSGGFVVRVKEVVK